MKFLFCLISCLAFINSVYSQNEYQCRVLGKCVDAGERCDFGYYFNSSVPSYRVKVSCKTGYFCPDSDYVYEPTCTAYSGLGETCTINQNSLEYQVSQCGYPYTCMVYSGSKTGTCQLTEYLAFGESCTYDQQCNGTNLICYDGKCGLEPRTKCISDSQCPVGTYCNRDLDEWEEDQCIPWKKNGDMCTSNNQCSYSSVCIHAQDTSPVKTCQPQFSKKSGQSCSTYPSYYLDSIQTTERFECDYGLECYGSICTQIPTSNAGAACNGSSECDGSCQCTSASSYYSPGKCLAPKIQLNNECKTSIQNLQKCAVSNSCSLSIVSPDSCLLKHCRSEYCTSECETPNSDIFQCGEKVNPICNPPSSSSIIIPSLLALISIIIVLII